MVRLFNLALQFLLLAAQFFFLFRELVLFRRNRVIGTGLQARHGLLGDGLAGVGGFPVIPQRSRADVAARSAI